ncbi:MAG TPA: hypothetical protein PLQ31_13080, partial [Thermoanaerobaculia bacterium]|nr:hypothetical protein [Thermoanaerobaculia bacterium]
MSGFEGPLAARAGLLLLLGAAFVLTLSGVPALLLPRRSLSGSRWTVRLTLAGCAALTDGAWVVFNV